MAKLKVGDVVCPKGKHLFNDTFGMVAKTITHTADFEGQPAISFNGGIKYHKAINYIDDPIEIAVRETALENVLYVHAEDYRVEDNDFHTSSVSGEEKVGHHDVCQALNAAWHMAYRYGGEWVYYKCPVCGKYHVGKNEKSN